mmetsp:Transcript_21187/g.44732  ORF Transcript_21187/g.44732 Transcript_21187/m.44732 type:complete len:82 (+) Transcript_21187:834-1079(+)
MGKLRQAQFQYNSSDVIQCFPHAEECEEDANGSFAAIIVRILQKRRKGGCRHLTVLFTLLVLNLNARASLIQGREAEETRG